MHAPHHVFVSGATGYLGRALSEALIAREHTVHGLARPASAHRLVTGVQPVLGDALVANSFVASVPPADTFVHLVGTPSPNPGKVAEFRAVDLNSVEAAIAAAHTAGVQHLVYVSVAQPAPVMRAFVKAREEAEGLIRASGMNATILRPWYVLGPGHRWAYALKPVYALTAHISALRSDSLRLGLLTLADMTRALVHAVEHPAHGIMVLDVPAMRALPHD